MIVHGRYDVVTPAKIAVDLARAWPEADLRIVADAGHAMTEAGIVHELVTATNRFAVVRPGPQQEPPTLRDGPSALLRVRIDLTDEAQGNVALMRRGAMLDEIDPLPGAEHHPPAHHRN